MIDPRLYRAALVPALLAMIVAAFSLANRPRPFTTTLAADFDGAAAERDLARLARLGDRAPGGAGDLAVARLVRRRLGAAGFAVRTRTVDGVATIDGTRTLQTVIGVREGTLSEQLVVLAHRDARASPARAELSGTAALLELARVFRGRKLRRTLVLVSTSGGSGGAAGAADFARDATRPTDAALVLGDVAGPRLRRPVVVPWSSGTGRAPLRLTRTVEAAVRAEAGIVSGESSPIVQFARLALPLASGEQGALGGRGVPAVLLQVSGERGPSPADPAGRRRLTDLGRAAVRSLTALDAAPRIGGGPEALLVARRKVVPGWAVRLLVGTLILPVLVVTVDGVARLRRRREPVGRWVVWTLSAALPFLLAASFAAALELVGLLPDAPGAPVPAQAIRAGGAAIAAMVSIGLVFVLGWVTVRPAALRALGAGGDPGASGAGAGVAVVLSGLVAAVWLANPFASAALLPALHLWVLAGLPELARARWVAVLAILGGVLGPAAVLAIDAAALGVGPLDLPWTTTLLVTGGAIGVSQVLALSLALGCLVAVALVVARRRSPGAPPVASVRGPGSYAGPGSLGGTESALGR